MKMMKYKLNQLGDFKNGANYPKDSYGKGDKIVNVKDLFRGRFVDETSLDELKPGVLRDKSIYQTEDGDILFTRFSLVRSGAGMCAMIHNPSQCILFCGFIIRYRLFDKTSVYPLYLLYLLRSPQYRNLFTGNQQTNITNINQDSLGDIDVYLPVDENGDIDYTEQVKLVSVLNALDDKIALNKKMNQKLEAMAKRLYDYWFVQYDFPDKNGHPYKTTGGPMTYNPTLKREIPAGWEVKKVSDYADLITKGTTPSTLGFDFQDVGINFVKVECIENGQILQENLMHISEEAHDAMKRSQLHGNDILVTIAGRLGSAAIVSEHILPANTNQAVALIRMKKEYGHLVNYIYRVISSSSMQKRLQGSNAQSIQKNLTLPILGDIEFVQDSNCEIIKRFNEITKPIFLRQQENIQEITRLTALRDKLLPLLMNGQVKIKENVKTV